jgi:chromosome segregation ATPase
VLVVLIITQNQEKDLELNRKNEELMKLRVQVQEHQLKAPTLDAEIHRLRENLTFAQNELSLLRESVNVIEPKLTRLEPELNLLRDEREAWLQQQRSMESELIKLRPIGRMLSDITSELVQLSDLSDANAAGNHAIAGASAESIATGSFGSSAGRGFAGASSGASAADTAGSMESQGISLSQRHSLWVGLPSIRSLNATLYENIRRLAHDLHAKEVQANDLHARLQYLTADAEQCARSNESQWQQLSRQQEAASQTIQRLTDLVNTTEKELVSLRANRITVDQIRAVLGSYPGNVSELKIHELTLSSSMSSSSSFGGRRHMVDQYSSETKRSDHSGSPQSKEHFEALLSKVQAKIRASFHFSCLSSNCA